MYRRLSVFVHPKKCVFDPRENERAIKVTTCALGKVISERDYEYILNNKEWGDSYEVNAYVLFSTVQTERENEIRFHDARIAGEEEERAAQKRAERAKKYPTDTQTYLPWSSAHHSNIPLALRKVTFTYIHWLHVSVELSN